MLEYDWLLRALIYGLIGCSRSKLSDLTCPITNIIVSIIKCSNMIGCKTPLFIQVQAVRFDLSDYKHL